MKDAHRALRDGTRAEHERLDALFAGFDLADRASYAGFLHAHADALLPVEAMLDAHAGQVVDDWAERRRGDLLLADLADLGVLPRNQNPGASGGDAVAETAGALYVIEGSRLGGRFLVERVAAGLPRRYLGAEQPRGRWPALLAALDQSLPNTESTERAIVAARATFARFEAAARAHLAAD